MVNIVGYFFYFDQYTILCLFKKINKSVVIGDFVELGKERLTQLQWGCGARIMFTHIQLLSFHFSEPLNYCFLVMPVYFSCWHLLFYSLMYLTTQDRCISLFSKWLHGSHLKASEAQSLNSLLYLKNPYIFLYVPFVLTALGSKSVKSCIFLTSTL